MIDKFKTFDSIERERQKQLENDRVLFNQIVGNMNVKLKDEEERNKRKRIKLFEIERQKQLESDKRLFEERIGQLLMNIEGKEGGLSK